MFWCESKQSEWQNALPPMCHLPELLAQGVVAQKALVKLAFLRLRSLPLAQSFAPQHQSAIQIKEKLNCFPWGSNTNDVVAGRAKFDKLIH